MINLRWRTKKGGSPQQKERVYFTCCPDDFSLCFESICCDIFEHQDCAIYYKEDLDAKWDERDIEIELGRMKLFVIPITTQFLTKENDARNVELPYAIEHVIPVLPLIQEDGLESLFTEKCNGLHALNKTANVNDSTTIPYDKKLKKFLDSVLLGDTLSSKVRDEFAAHIFMSYRKKDREYEQKLMRLIHKNDFCRDVAIWYDEFLVPGEKFTPEIQKEIEKKDLFSIVVTPNILEDPNYVKDYEYPEADNDGKLILPIEMVPTDIEKIRKVDKFKTMPNLISAEDEDALSTALAEMLPGLKIEESNCKPEHLYYIGLAYLNGLEVEVDCNRAVNLITIAAEAGMPEAIKKLSEMYEKGEGVARDYEKSAFWLDCYAEYWRNKFLESGEEEDLCQHCEALRDLGNAMYDMGRLDFCESVYLKLLSTGEDAYTQFCERTYLDLMSFCYTMLGKISKTKGQTADAEKRWRKSMQLDEEIIREMRSCSMLTPGYIDQNEHDEGEKCLTEAYWNLVSAYINLGEIKIEEECFQDAWKLNENALMLMEKLSDETGVIKRPQLMAGVFNNLGRIRLNEERYEDAEEWYRKALEWRELLFREKETLESRIDLQDSYNNFGTLYRAEGDFGKAEEWYRKALDLIQELDSRTLDMMEVRIKQSDIYCNLAGLSEEEEDFDRAKEWHLKEIAIKEDLRRDTGSFEIRMDLAASYINMGAFCIMEEGREIFSEAEEWNGKALELSEELYRESGDPKARQNLAGVYQNLGLIRLREKYFDDAEEFYRESMELTGESDEERLNLVSEYISYAEICMEKEVYSKAREWLMRALGWMKEQYRDTPSTQTGINLSVIYGDLGVCSRGEDGLVDSKEWYLECIDLLEELSNEPDELYLDVLCNLAMAYDNMGEICLKEDNPDQAKEWYLQGLNVKEELDMEIGSFDTLGDMAYSFYMLGTLDDNHYDFMMLENAKNLLSQLLDLYPQDPRCEETEQKLQFIQWLLTENNSEDSGRGNI